MNVASRTLPQKLGKYEVRREVGRGGMGIVYEGFDPLIDRRVALKTFINEYFDATQSDNVLTRLRREAQAAGRLSHPNIIAVYDYGEDVVKDAAGAETCTAFIAMEFVEGRSLENYFAAQQRFTMPQIERIMSQLLDALEYSHTHGVVHRDIKPANIILLADGTVKVADFGVARLESSTLTQVGTVLGSPSYMSPEQLMGQTVDGRSDLYSAGVVLYQLLTSEVPFTGAFAAITHRVLNDNAPPPSALNVQVPRGFDAILRRAMAKRPDERYQSAGELKAAVLAAKSTAGETDLAADSRAAAATVLRPRSAASALAARKLASRAVLFTTLGVASAAVIAAYFLWNAHPSQPTAAKAGGRTTEKPPDTVSPPSSESASNGDSAVISAVGVVNPADPTYAKDLGAAERMMWLDARRQLVAKAAALYVEPDSLNANYGIVRTRLLARSDDFITTVLQQQPAQLSKDGLMLGTLRASVKIRDVQKSLNQISRDERVDFIRNNGDPRISVAVRASNPDADPASEAPHSAVAENLLKERIRSFGFSVVDDAAAKPPADFHVESEVSFKKLSARLAASGLTIEKFVLTSWTVKAVDARSGEEIFHNTAIPERQSWATQELALQAVGQLIGEEFTKGFFLQYFDFQPKQARLHLSGLPPAAAGILLARVNADLAVLNASVHQEGSDIIMDTELSGTAASLPDLVQRAILMPLNRRLGMTCFTLAHAEATDLHVIFDSACNSAATIDRLQAGPRDALTGVPKDAAKGAGSGRVKT